MSSLKFLSSYSSLQNMFLYALLAVVFRPTFTVCFLAQCLAFSVSHSQVVQRAQRIPVHHKNKGEKTHLSVIIRLSYCISWLHRCWLEHHGSCHEIFERRFFHEQLPLCHSSEAGHLKSIVARVKYKGPWFCHAFCHISGLGWM
jgi:hypothetical protein